MLSSRFIRLPLILLTALTLIALATGTALARHGDDDEGENVISGVPVVNTSTHTVVINGVSIAVTSGTRIELNDASATLDQLAAFVAQNPSTVATVEYFNLGGQLTAKEIQVGSGHHEGGDDDDDDDHGGGGVHQDFEIRGTLTAANAKAATVTVLPEGATEALTLTVTPTSQIEIDDADATLDQLAALLAGGTAIPVEVHYDPTTSSLLRIDAEVEVEQSEDQVVSVNSHSHLLTVRHLVRAANRKATQYVLLKGVVIVKGSSLIKLTELKRGQHVRVSSVLQKGKRLAPKVVVTSP